MTTMVLYNKNFPIRENLMGTGKGWYNTIFFSDTENESLLNSLRYSFTSAKCIINGSYMSPANNTRRVDER